jgi:protein involved in polysaccharide export with SLBB domain
MPLDKLFQVALIHCTEVVEIADNKGCRRNAHQDGRSRPFAGFGPSIDERKRNRQMGGKRKQIVVPLLLACGICSLCAGCLTASSGSPTLRSALTIFAVSPESPSPRIAPASAVAPESAQPAPAPASPYLSVLQGTPKASVARESLDVPAPLVSGHPLDRVPPSSCRAGESPIVQHVSPQAPRERAKVTLPSYVIEPPDILLIDALRVVPLPPYHIEALDALGINVTETLPEQPISGIYPVEPEGTVNLLFTYGMVPVAGLTIEEARQAIEKHLKQILKEGFQVSVTLARSGGVQQIRGEHLVRPDGTIGLGSYGGVNVSGLTISQAKGMIESYLGQFLLNPKISLDVAAFNSKVYYLITDGAGNGEQVIRFPVTGGETVLDALGQINGLSPVSSKKIWVVRPSSADPNGGQVLPVDWVAITQRGATATNYQILPGDRIYVKAQSLIAVDNYLAKVYAPIERTFGIILLGTSTVNSVQGRTTNGSGL